MGSRKLTVTFDSIIRFQILKSETVRKELLYHLSEFQNDTSQIQRDISDRKCIILGRFGQLRQLSLQIGSQVKSL